MGSIRSGQVAIITGGASGIGRAVAHAMAARGVTCMIFDIDDVAAKAVVGERESRGLVRAMHVDVRQREAVAAAVQEVHAERGLDYMFNNAGISVLGEVADYDWAAWEDVIATNLMGVVHGVSACYPLMVAQGHGHIINTGSLASLFPTPWVTSYSAAKAGVWGLSMALRGEAERYGVKVSCVCPAAVETPMAHTARYINIDGKRAFTEVPGDRISAEACAVAILEGVEQNASLIKPSAARWISLAYRLAPDNVAKMLRGVSNKFVALREDYLQASRTAP